jgi:hypothetical protein
VLLGRATACRLHLLARRRLLLVFMLAVLLLLLLLLFPLLLFPLLLGLLLLCPSLLPQQLFLLSLLLLSLLSLLLLQGQCLMGPLPLRLPLLLSAVAGAGPLLLIFFIQCQVKEKPALGLQGQHALRLQRLLRALALGRRRGRAAGAVVVVASQIQHHCLARGRLQRHTRWRAPPRRRRRGRDRLGS